MIGPGDRPEQIDLVGVQEAFHEKVAVGVKPRDLIGGGSKTGHRGVTGRRTILSNRDVPD
jgi:hypothetical protein